MPIKGTIRLLVLCVFFGLGSFMWGYVLPDSSSFDSYRRILFNWYLLGFCQSHTHHYSQIQHRYTRDRLRLSRLH